VRTYDSPTIKKKNIDNDLLGHLFLEKETEKCISKIPKMSDGKNRFSEVAFQRKTGKMFPKCPWFYGIVSVDYSLCALLVINSAPGHGWSWLLASCQSHGYSVRWLNRSALARFSGSPCLCDRLHGWTCFSTDPSIFSMATFLQMETQCHRSLPEKEAK
jgi:hypothetical protein